MQPIDLDPLPGNLRKADELTYREIAGLDRDRTVCVCAVSALEVHGPHLPIGSDLHQAAWMADETARRFAERHGDWTVLTFPPIPIGTDELPLPGSFNTPARVYYRVVLAFGKQLARAGFRYIVLMNAHGGPRHAAALETACRRISRRHGVSMITPSIRALHRMVTGEAFEQVEERIGRRLRDDEREGLLSGEHAGAWETSWYLAQRPELLSPEYKSLLEGHPPEVRFLSALGRGFGGGLERIGRPEGGRRARELVGALSQSIGWLLNARSGYGREGTRVTYKGWPAVASPEVGRAYSELPVEMCLEDLEAVIEGRLEAKEVRSIASDPAIIQPWFFRVVAVSVAAAVLFIGWALS
jgi:creatinine amidohydrolase/Fe(II)-dependent formamide hydrolase-like protein